MSVYAIRVVGTEVTVSGPNDEVYTFIGGYGDYSLTFDRTEVEEVCTLIANAESRCTSWSLTDCIKHVREYKANTLGATKLLS